MVSLFRQLVRAEDPAYDDLPLVDAGERIYAIGDIHGRIDVLYQMIELIVEDVERCTDTREPRLIFLGDYIDRGDNSRDVIDALMMIEKELVFEGVDCLLGNHEAALLAFLDAPETRHEWLRFGGMQTLASYMVAPPSARMEPDELISVRDALCDSMGPHLSFFRACKQTIRSGDVIFAHAGIDPHLPLNAQSDAATLWGRSGFLDSGGVPGLRVVHGHYDGPEPVMAPHRICVDTGAYYTGQLTAVRLDAGEKLLVTRN